MDEKYIVLEIQITSADKPAVISFGFSNLNEAEAKYHELLSVAALSTIPKHAASLLSEEGVLLESHCYAH